MSKGTLIAIGATLAAVIVAVLIGREGWNAATYQDDMLEAAGKVAAALFVIALLLERAMAVVNDLLFGEQTVDLTSQARVATLEARADALAEAQWKLDALEEEKRRVRLAGSFLAAVLVAAAGARTLGGLLLLKDPAGAQLASDQLQLFRTVDIVLTAGLLAGGSNGIAAIIDVIRKRIEVAKANQEARLVQAQLVGPASALSLRRERAGFGPAVGAETHEYGKANVVGEGADAADDHLAFVEWQREEGLVTAESEEAIRAKPWRVAKSLAMLRGQLNASFPDRSKVSDGTIGDERHCGAGGGTSDHCPNITDGSERIVTAFDATHDPAHGCDMNAVTNAVVASQDPRIKYIIWNRRICSSRPMGGYPAWAWRAYSGANPHTRHAHFSVRPEKAHYDADGPWTIA